MAKKREWMDDADWQIVHNPLIYCALRFDGLKWYDATHRHPDEAMDFIQFNKPVVRTLTLHNEEELNWAAFFSLQRYLFKWGGEYLGHDSPEWLAFWHLFLALYRQQTPARWCHEEYETAWQERYRLRIEDAAARVRRYLATIPKRAPSAPALSPISASYDWSHLTKLQLGRYAEYFVRMELMLRGGDVFAPELDDRGVDFALRLPSGAFRLIQVKSTRKLAPVFISQSKMPLEDNFWIALVLMRDSASPEIFLIPSVSWQSASDLFKPYVGGKIKTWKEWHLTLSAKTLPLLEPFRLDVMARQFGLITP